MFVFFRFLSWIGELRHPQTLRADLIAGITVADNPELEYIIIDGQGINQLDATGEEVLHHLAERLRAQGSRSWWRG
ncbi:hypothetical protein [Thiocapsa sp.]|uniref:hypothetical protein n=1 Tax=Thiocapsa sp. TaxID=2024551 RepID=UPI0035942C6F